MTVRTVEVARDRLDGWLERFRANNPDGPQRVAGIERFEHTPLAVLLVRRGGYAVALVDSGRLVAHKVGTRRVQSRTAAGGWSQQRFARRRANQADELVGVVREHLLAVVGERAAAGLVVGGDRALVTQVLDDRRCARLASLPRREFADLPDPRRAVLEDVVLRASAARVAIEE